jgi:hypothetical protein
MVLKNLRCKIDDFIVEADSLGVTAKPTQSPSRAHLFRWPVAAAPSPIGQSEVADPIRHSLSLAAAGGSTSQEKGRGRKGAGCHTAGVAAAAVACEPLSTEGLRSRRTTAASEQRGTHRRSGEQAKGPDARRSGSTASRSQRQGSSAQHGSN